MKKWIPIALTAVIAVVFCSGCAKKETAQSSSVETETTAAATEKSQITETTTAQTAAATLSPVYPTDVPEIHASTKAPQQQVIADFSWDRIKPNTINGTNEVYTPEITTPIDCLCVADSAFANNESVKSAAFLNPNTEIGSSAFASCTNLQELSLPQYIETISPYAFQDCISLRILELPESVTTIEESAFFGCTSLIQLSMQQGLQKIGTTAFYGCSALSIVSIPEGVTEIGDYAFGNCAALANVYVPASVRNAGLYPFSGSADLAVEEQKSIQIFVKENSWMDVNFDMVCSGTSCVKMYY